ncbi:ABC transporter ATP-binding protein [Testudinibacter sp. P27/CKL/0425]
MTALIELQQVTFQAQQVLHYPDSQILAEQVTFLQGPSGSGKSTLLRLINGSESLSGGQILYQGQNIEQLDSIQLRRELLLMNQRLFLFPQSIRENFEQFYRYLDKSPPNSEQIKQFLHICHVDFELDASCNTLSGGEQQRVFLALALSLQPKLLMLDEPTSALDAELAETVLSEILAYCREQRISVLAISHDRRLTERHADQIIQIKKD